MQTKVKKLADKIYWVGVNDYDLRVFDIIMETEFGSTYNAYLVIGSEKTALIDTAKVDFQDDYIAKVQSLIDIKKIDYVVLNHTEPDHSGSVDKLLDLNPDLTIVATAAGLSNLKEIVNRPFKAVQAKDDAVLSLGNRSLRFFNLPNLHWPDTMFTWLEEEKILFTCDFFGAHYAFEGVFAKNVKEPEDYRKALKDYFDAIMSPFLKFVQKGLERIKDLPLKYVATSHGPVLDETNIEEAKALYAKWAQIKPKNAVPLVVIPVASAYGYTKKMAEEVKRGIETGFAGNVKVEIYDVIGTMTHYIVDRIAASDAFLIGSTTILSDTLKPIWDILSSMNPVVNGGKFASAFGSYGWSGEAVPNIMVRLSQLKMKTIEGYRLRFNPSDDQLKETFDFGVKFARFMQG
ncbi:MAG TPA: FprA family A-type flavoprotein [Acholeplasmatales bacterium]|nr:FprA family A-type flavoprotein [Acholeplasmatales bacterium]